MQIESLLIESGFGLLDAGSVHRLSAMAGRLVGLNFFLKFFQVSYQKKSWRLRHYTNYTSHQLFMQSQTDTKSACSLRIGYLPIRNQLDSLGVDPKKMEKRLLF